MSSNGTFSSTASWRVLTRIFAFTFAAVSGVIGPSLAVESSTAPPIQRNAGASTVRQASTKPLRVDGTQRVVTVTDNWSGYLLPSVHTLLTRVAGSWHVPSLDCSRTPDGKSSEWVGIGGARWKTGGTSGTLLQTGTNSDCDHGTQVNSGWTEEVPSSPNHQIVFSNFPIGDGDTIDAQVYKSASGVWCTRVTDATTQRFGLLQVGSNWNIYTSQGVAIGPEQGSAAGLSYSGGYSAEWIVEDPTDSDSRTVDQFANFNSVTFRDLITNLTHWSLPVSDSVDMVQHGALLSYPSPLEHDNFTVQCAMALSKKPSAKGDLDDGHLTR